MIGALALLGGFLSGLLGIGGGIIMGPLLLCVPPLFGLEPLSMHTVAGLTIVQGLVACLFGAVAHNRFNFVAPRLAVWMGTVIFAAALLGGAGAGYLSNRLLLQIFAGLASAAAVLIYVRPPREEESPDVRTLVFSHWRAAGVAGWVGLLGGLVGQGGSFILIPLLTSFVKIPTRIALGSNLAIVLLSSSAAFIGKAVTGQIEWLLAVPIVLAVIPAAYLGGLVSSRVPVLLLRRALAIVIGLAAIRIWYSLFL